MPTGKPLDPQIYDAIHGAPPTETTSALAARLGISRRACGIHRKAARADRREASREVARERVEREAPSALDDLAKIRKMSMEVYAGSKAADDGRLALAATKTTLDYLGIEKDPGEFAGRSDEELLHFAQTGEWPDE